jgi:hypothetical protein
MNGMGNGFTRRPSTPRGGANLDHFLREVIPYNPDPAPTDPIPHWELHIALDLYQAVAAAAGNDPVATASGLYGVVALKLSPLLGPGAYEVRRDGETIKSGIVDLFDGNLPPALEQAPDTAT